MGSYPAGTHAAAVKQDFSLLPFSCILSPLFVILRSSQRKTGELLLTERSRKKIMGIQLFVVIKTLGSRVGQDRESDYMQWA